MKQLWYFSAGWCSGCKQLDPVMDQVAKQGIVVNKMDVDYTPDVTVKYKVQSIPTVILVRDGQEVKRFTGARSINEVMNFYNG
jgi:thioredoxin-like negative regulator of GroEL